MPYHIHVMQPDASVTVTLRNDPPTLDQLQKAVGGLIQVVPELDRYGNRDCVAYCNEEGLLEGLPINFPATDLWRKHLDETVGPNGYHPDMAILVGPVVFVSVDTADELERL